MAPQPRIPSLTLFMAKSETSQFSASAHREIDGRPVHRRTPRRRRGADRLIGPLPIELDGRWLKKAMHEGPCIAEYRRIKCSRSEVQRRAEAVGARQVVIEELVDRF